MKLNNDENIKYKIKNFDHELDKLLSKRKKNSI